MHDLQKAVLIFLHIPVCSHRLNKWLEPTFFYYYFYIMLNRSFMLNIIMWNFFLAQFITWGILIKQHDYCHQGIGGKCHIIKSNPCHSDAHNCLVIEWALLYKTGLCNRNMMWAIYVILIFPIVMLNFLFEINLNNTYLIQYIQNINMSTCTQ